MDAGLAMGSFGLALAAERRDDGGDPGVGDRIRVGGLPSTLQPSIVAAGRVFEPALQEGALTGTAYEGERVALDLPGLPLQPFWARHRVELARGWSDWLALAGLDVTLRLPPLALVRLPALDLRLGGAYVLDEPYRNDVRGWVALTYRP